MCYLKNWTTFLVDNMTSLCRFSNHSVSNRVSCCSPQSETAMLLTAQGDYSNILKSETAIVIQELGKETQLKGKISLPIFTW